jgi:hypothetical protein
MKFPKTLSLLMFSLKVNLINGRFCLVRLFNDSLIVQLFWYYTSENAVESHDELQAAFAQSSVDDFILLALSNPHDGS